MPVRPDLESEGRALRDSYARSIRMHFGYEGYSYGTKTKIFGEPNDCNPAEHARRQKNGVPRVAKAKLEPVYGSPNLGTFTTSRLERVFLTVRQELTRFTRQTLGYPKDLRMHRLAVSLHFGIYNLVRKHKTIGTTPAVAAGIEEKPWTMEMVVEMTEPLLAAKARGTGCRQSSREACSGRRCFFQGASRGV